jgi:hypothetical protein
MSDVPKYDRTDLTGSDFREIDLAGKNLAHSTLTGCRFRIVRGVNFNCSRGTEIDFQTADITGATFEKTDESVLQCLVGAEWNGIPITGVSGWITHQDGEYWCFCTNAFVQIGCMVRTLAEWETIGTDEESIKALHLEQPKIDLAATLAWWRKHYPAILAAHTALQSP